MDLYRGALGAGSDQALEVSVAGALLRSAGRGESGSALRVYRPTAGVVAFGRRDTLRPGFGAAVEVARRAGFTPVVRAPGGRAVAYTEDALVVDHIGTNTDALSGMDERFRGYAEVWKEVLGQHGVQAEVGAVPGEYCPGAYSVNARGRVKLVGTAQRILRGAWLFSAVVVLGGDEVLRPVLSGIYRELDMPFDGDAVGSVRTEVPGQDLTAFESTVLAAYDDRFGLTPRELDRTVLATAHEMHGDHQL